MKLSVILLDSKKIISALHHQSVVVEVFKEIDSTNDYLLKKTDQSNAICVCIAETQTRGRGRLSRPWHSPFGKNIYFSMRYPFEKKIDELSGLSLVVALAMAHAIESIVKLKNHPLTVKWPNDVLVGGAKLAGVLIETRAGSEGGCQAIIGIGINVNMRVADKNFIDQSWTSLFNITNHEYDRHGLCVALIDTLCNYLDRFALSGFSTFLKEWEVRDCLVGNSISVMSGNQKYTGTCLGITEQGHLLLKTADSVIHACAVGDITLLK